MKCAKAQKRIAFLVNGEIDAQHRHEVEEHLRRCGACQALAAQYKDLAQRARTLASPNALPGFYDTFFQKIWSQISREVQPQAKVFQRSPLWTALRPRYAVIGAAVILTGIVAIFLFSKIAAQRRQAPLEAYLTQRNFQGLVQALADPRQRPFFMQDSVSVDLLIESCEFLELIHKRHGQVSQPLAEALQIILWEGQRRDDRGRAFTAGGLPINLLAGQLDFKAAVRNIRRLKQFGAKITLLEVGQAWTGAYRITSMKGTQTP
jgi:hypothetical protein